MECCTQQWKLDKYARFLGDVPTQPRGRSLSGKPKSTENMKWKLYERGQGTLLLTVTDSHHFVITYNNEIQENHLLWDAMSWMKGVSKEDSLLIIYRLQDETRQFRVKFSCENNNSALEQCQSCISRLSKYFIFKSLDRSTPPAIKISAQGNKETTAEVTLAKLSQIITGNLTTSLPRAYQTTHLPTEPAFIQAMIQLCLSDSNFPGFVAAVQTALNNIISDEDGSCNVGRS